MWTASSVCRLVTSSVALVTSSVALVTIATATCVTSSGVLTDLCQASSNKCTFAVVHSV